MKVSRIFVCNSISYSLKRKSSFSFFDYQICLRRYISRLVSFSPVQKSSILFSYSFSLSSESVEQSELSTNFFLENAAAALQRLDKSACHRILEFSIASTILTTFKFFLNLRFALFITLRFLCYALQKVGLPLFLQQQHAKKFAILACKNSAAE